MGRRAVVVAVVLGVVGAPAFSHASPTPVQAGATAVAARGAVRIHAPADPWVAFDVPGLRRGAARYVTCCPLFPVADPPRTTTWAAATGAQDGLLIMVSDPTPSPNEQFAYPFRYFRPQADGVLWWFDAWGFDDETRAQLADTVVQMPDGSFRLDDPRVVPLASGLADLGNLRAQVYTSPAGRVTLSVGEYRGQLLPFTAATSVRRVVIGNGAPGWVANLGGERTRAVWPIGSRWAMLEVTKGLASRTDEILAAIRSADPRDTVPTPLTHPDIHDQLRGSVTVIETPSHGPMIATILLSSLPPQGGDVPLRGWNWDDVEDEEILGGTRWGGPWEITGTWDGTTFTLTQPPRATPAVWEGTFIAPTPGCDLESLRALQTQIRGAASRVARVLASGTDAWDGDCGVALEVFADSPALREALQHFAGQLTELTFVVHPVN